MKGISRRTLAVLSMVAALAATLAPASASAAGLQTNFFVGTCMKGSFADISSAIDAANNPQIKALHKTITLCPGTYTLTSSPSVIQTDNLIIEARHGAIVTTSAPFSGSIFKASTTNHVTIMNLVIVSGGAYSGTMIEMDSSTNARLLHISIDGAGSVAASSVGMDLSNSDGSILNSTVINWHSPAWDGTNPSTALEGAGAVANQVHISDNHVTDYEGTAISVSGVGSADVDGNKIIGTHTAANPPAVDGILSTAVAAGRISANAVDGPGMHGTAGIENEGSSAMRFVANKVTGWDSGIRFTLDCTHATANGNLVEGNKITDALSYGVDVEAPAIGCDQHADNTVIRDNTITNTGVLGLSGIHLLLGSGANFGYAQNQVIRFNRVKHFDTALTPPAVNPPYYTGTLTPNFLIS